MGQQQKYIPLIRWFVPFSLKFCAMNFLCVLGHTWHFCKFIMHDFVSLTHSLTRSLSSSLYLFLYHFLSSYRIPSLQPFYSMSKHAISILMHQSRCKCLFSSSSSLSYDTFIPRWNFSSYSMWAKHCAVEKSSVKTFNNMCHHHWTEHSIVWCCVALKALFVKCYEQMWVSLCNILFVLPNHVCVCVCASINMKPIPFHLQSFYSSNNVVIDKYTTIYISTFYVVKEKRWEFLV